MTDLTSIQHRLNSELVALYSGTKGPEEELKSNICPECRQWPCGCEER